MRNCEYCRQQFMPNAHSAAWQQFCSAKCQQQYGYLRRKGRLSEREPELPVEFWTEKVIDLPRLSDFRVYCVNCGSDDWLQKTEQEIRSLLVLERCDQCGGARWIEPDFGKPVAA